MKIAVIGSRCLTIENLENYLPDNVTELVSGGAKGIDTDAKIYAEKNHLPIKEFIPNYAKFGKSAPLKRNLEIIAYADYVIAFWNGKSKGTKFVIDNCKKQGIPIKVYILQS